MNKASDLEDTPVNDRYANGMHEVPPSMTGNYMPSGPDVEIDYSKFTYGPKQNSADESDSKPSEYASCESDSSVETSTSMPEPVENASKVVCEPKVWTDAPIIKEHESDSDNDSVSNVQEDKEKPSFAFTDSVKHDDPHRALKDKGIIDSGCSRHMTGNKGHLDDYQEFKGGSVAFRGSNGRIISKGKINTGRFDFEDVYYVEELKHYNLFYVSQMCDKKNKGNLVRGLPSKILKNDHTYVACQKGKQHKASYAVNTARYVLNRVLVTKPQNKTPYELLTGTQANDDHGANLEEIDLHEEHFVLPIWSAYSTTIKSSGDKIKKNTSFKTYEKPVSQVEQVFLEELEKLKRQEKEATDAAESLRREATHDIQNVSTSSSNLLNTNSTPLSTAGPSREFNDGELSYLDDPLMPHLEDIYASPSEGIFTDSSYDDEGVSAFMYGTIDKEVCVSQPPGFVDPKFPNKVYKVVKALYGLHQAPKSWYATLSTFLEKSGYIRGAIDKTLLIKQDKKDIMLVQVYMDDIIFGSTKKSWCDKFEELMKNSVKTASTPIETQKPLVKDKEATDVDVHLYRFQVTSKTSHLQAV
nr:copia protein [Tanacetum cinerariifolium]